MRRANLGQVRTDAMDVGAKLYAGTPEQWRQWLEMHGSSEKSIWLVFFKKGTGKHGISYEDAVEEALCCGWIDGQMKSIDGESYARRFSPRRKGGNWSEANRDLARRLLLEGRMSESGLETLPPECRGEDTAPEDDVRPEL